MMDKNHCLLILTLVSTWHLEVSSHCFVVLVQHVGISKKLDVY